MAFQFKFNASLPHQTEAISNVVVLFDGLAKADVGFQLSNEIVPNVPEADDLADYWLEENLHSVQQRHNDQHPEAVVPVGRLERDDGPLLEGVSNDSYGCPHFTLEMETGTGKTYVYYRTMLELHNRFGLRKFIVVVPSVAILEGVKKTFEVTKQHFVSIYGVNNFGLIEHDGAHLARIGNFAKSSFPVVMVMTQQSFNRAANNLYKATEKLSGELKPYQWIQKTRPVVILDEPQNMGSDRAREAIRTLKPLFVLRYSATHRQGQQPNPVYRLTPVQAFRHGLVKQIEVIGVAELGTLTANMLRLEDVLRNPIRAQVKVLVLKDGMTSERQVTLKQGDRLKKHTGLVEHEGLVVSEIVVGKDGEPSTLELTGGAEGGMIVSTGDEVVGSRVDVWRAQIERTIETHFERQRTLRGLGVKVLSLFFIDRVSNYVGEPGTIRRLFDECFERLKARHADWSAFTAGEVQSGYFAKTKKKDKSTKVERDVYLDEVSSDSDEAKEAFKLIMRDKERLLSFPDGQDQGKNVAFIFAHSALKEGWDNPNVFQICTLNQTTSSAKKRQEIGRGLRLCVDQQGNRPDGVNLNILTVIANESYESYVRNLQQDYVNDGETAPPPPKRPADSVAKRRQALYDLTEFRIFWRRLCQKLTYSIEIDTTALVRECAKRLNAAVFPEPVLTVSHGRFIVVDYAIRVEKRITGGSVQLIIEERSSAGVPLVLGFMKPDERDAVVKLGDDLGRLLKNSHLRGLKVMKIWDQYGEVRVRFANDIEISPSEVYRFQATRIDETKEREKVVATESHPVPDVIGRAAEETNLTRATLADVFQQVHATKRQLLIRNPEGWINVFVAEVKEAMAEHIAARVRYHATGETLADPDDPGEFFPATVKQPQKELVPGGKKSLYDMVQVDSDVERQFIDKRLIPDEENLALYFKFPPKFRIEIPHVIGYYNPDWGIVRFSRDGTFALELVRETKGSDKLAELRFPNEARKIVVAQRYFAALGIDFRHLSPKADLYWLSTSKPTPAARHGLTLVHGGKAPAGKVAVPVYSLQAAAGAFSSGQAPEALGHVQLPRRVARLPGLFVAQVVGDSMDRVVPSGSYCLWQHLRVNGAAGPAKGEYLIARRPNDLDVDLGEFTFKRWGGTGSNERLEPMSTNPVHKVIVLDPAERVEFIARFVQIIDDA